MYELKPGEKLRIEGIPVPTTEEGVEKIGLMQAVGSLLQPGFDEISAQSGSSRKWLVFGRTDEHEDRAIRLLDGRDYYTFTTGEVYGSQHDDTSRRIVDTLSPYLQHVRDRYQLQLIEMCFSKP